MATSPIDLSAGLVPASAPPPSSGGGIDLSAGLVPVSAPPPSAGLTDNPNGEGTYQMKTPQGVQAVPYSKVSQAADAGNVREGGAMNFATPQEYARWLKDKAYDPNAKHDGYVPPEFEQAKGALKSAVEVPNTIAGWLDSLQNHITDAAGVSRQAQARPAFEKAENAVAPGITNPTHGFDQGVGATAETLLEWAYGEGEAKAAVKGMSVAEKMQKAAGVAKFLSEHPGVAKAAGIGVRAGANAAGATAQGMLHGQNAEDAAEGGLIAGGTGAALEGGLAGIGAARAAYAAKAEGATKTLEDYRDAMAQYRQQVADRLTATDKANADYHAQVAQQNADYAAAMRQYSQALTDHANETQKARDAWKAEIDAQKQAHQSATEAYNEQVAKGKADHQDALRSWMQQLDQQAAEHAANMDEYNRTLGDHKQTVSALQNEAATALKTARQTEAQQGIKNTAKDAAEDAIGRFNEALGNGSKHVADAQGMSAGVAHFGDASDALQEAAKPVYDAINEATQGKFSQLQKARAQAIRAQDFLGADKAEAKIDTMLRENPGVSGQEWRAAKSAWADSKDLDKIHAAVEGAFNGISEDMAAQPGTGSRELRGGPLQTRLGGLLRGSKALSEERISQLIGQDGLAGLYRAAHLTSTPELTKATQELTQRIAEELPPPAPPVKPEPIAKPVPGAPPVKPTMPAPPPEPVPGAKPVRPEKPEPVKRPKPLPRLVKPTPPAEAQPKPLSYGKLGEYTALYGAGQLAGHAMGIPGGGEKALLARYVWRKIVTDPKVGQMAQYAVDYGASPERAAKVIAAMISSANERQQPGK